MFISTSAYMYVCRVSVYVSSTCVSVFMRVVFVCVYTYKYVVFACVRSCVCEHQRNIKCVLKCL